MDRRSNEYPKPVDQLLRNRNSVKESRFPLRATPPGPYHYNHGQWIWDSGSHAIIYASFGYPEMGANEIKAILQGQRKEDGFIPNFRRIGKGREWDPEGFTAMNWDIGTDYTQPQVLTHASMRVYESYVKAGKEAEGKIFLAEVYEGLDSFIGYFRNNRRRDPNSEIIRSNHPHETGRDSDEMFDRYKFGRIVRGNVPEVIRPLVDQLNRVTDYTSILAISARFRLAGWDLDKMNQILWFEDVMMNSIHADGMSHMADISQVLGKTEDEEKYRSLAHIAGEDIVTKMWSPKDQQFYGIDKNGPIDIVSISSLFPVLQPEIKDDQLKRIIFLLQSPDWFKTDHPISAGPVHSLNYDPDHGEKDRLWRPGQTWPIPNYLILWGLRMQRNLKTATNPEFAREINLAALPIAEASVRMTNFGYYEMNKSTTGEGLRIEGQGWSTLYEVIKKDLLPDLKTFAKSHE